MKMKSTLLLTFFIATLFSGNLFSQDGGGSGTSFDDGTNLVFIGFGVPPSAKIKKEIDSRYFNKILVNSNNYEYKYNNYGTAVLKYERGLIKYFGLGLNFEYSGASAIYKSGDTTNAYERKIKSNVIGGFVRFNGHFPIGDKFDVFAGAGLGYTYSLYKVADSYSVASLNILKKDASFVFDYQFTVGCRYMVKDNIGLFAEFGWATTPAQLGIVFKF